MESTAGTTRLTAVELRERGIAREKIAEAAASHKKSARQQAEKIKRWLRNQEMAKRASKSDEDEAEVEKAWKLLESSARRNWIIAYYAENSGELFVRPKPELQNCSECGGTGGRERQTLQSHQPARASGRSGGSVGVA